ncbi:hypothetical protein B0H17DRAFT_1033300 [Mycena rosella]|uniref:Uncharacterized protein n=1 Tax=Mycena rosella TaxID=1033263 RepID=A0AAD7MA15_MYCRO|nr:hypothetical protein B0H17DRAFT_1033300 [Mycena rosella]
MPFPFTFKLAVPGLNPFASPTETHPHSTVASTSQSPEKPRSRPARPNNINNRRPSPSPSPSAPVSRKRGWEPSFAEPSQSAATLASSSGYLDTPAKYREMVARPSGDEFELEDMAVSVSDLPPPAKRRRGLAGSIVSTAVSAALIGTAVGLTVYRLWRDRGKDSDSNPEPHPHPPPPYQKGEWTPIQQPQAIEITPPTPMVTPRRRKVRHGASTASGNKRHNPRVRSRVHGRALSPPAPLSPPRPLFNSDPAEDDEEAVAVEDQMDWIGDQLSMLIQEGQKALGREIVIKSDAREDEVDDGCGVWEEEEGGYDQEFGGVGSSNSLSRSSSPRQRKRPRNLTLAPPSYASRPPSASPRASRFEFTSASLPSSAGTRWRSDAPGGSVRGMSAESEFGRTPSGREEEQTWESPELKESMARARARLLGMRGAG